MGNRIKLIVITILGPKYQRINIEGFTIVLIRQVDAIFLLIKT